MAPFVAPLEYSGMEMECSEEIPGFAGLRSHVAPHKCFLYFLFVGGCVIVPKSFFNDIEPSGGQIFNFVRS